jgi:hypothetical protein
MTSQNNSIFSVGPLKVVNSKDESFIKASYDDFSLRTSKQLEYAKYIKNNLTEKIDRFKVNK